MRTFTTTYSGTILVMCIFAIACISTSCRRPQQDQSPEIALSERLIWANPDSAKQFLSCINTNKMAFDEKKLYELQLMKANVRMWNEVPADSMHLLLDYFKTQKEHQQTGELLYTMGIYYEHWMEFDSATFYLKEAQTYIPHLNDIYAGMIYFRIGSVHENEQLYHIALENYQAAIPHLERTHDIYRQACCLRDLARTVAEDEERNAYYERSIELAKQTGDSCLIYDILIQKEANINPMDSDLVLHLIEAYPHPRYASVAARIYLDQGDLPTAKQYLELLAADTALLDWSAHEYTYLESRIRYNEGNTEEAFNELVDTYLKFCHDIQKDGYARTYAIARQYDLEKAEQHAMQLTIDKQHLWLVIGSITTLSIILLLIAWIVYTREHLRRKQQEQNRQIEQLRAENAEKQLNSELQQRELSELKLREAEADIIKKREVLHELLLQRVELTRLLLGKNEIGQNLPEEIQKTLDQITFSKPENMEGFMDEFNCVHTGLIDAIRKAHPAINEQDELYIALAMHGLTPADIGTLLQMKKQSVWNRRQRLKKHLDLADMDIEEWINSVKQG